MHGDPIQLSSVNEAADFRSDNVGGAAPEILAALLAANQGAAASYGADDQSARVNTRFSALFEREVEVFPVPTGTAANALGLASCTAPWGAILSHAGAHAHLSECGATEMFSGGAKFIAVEGEGGKVAPPALMRAIKAAGLGETNRSQPMTLSLTQATEIGTVYRLDELDELSAFARAHGLLMHMDGARFANALAHLGCTPAEMSWRRGVDIASFGVTKNGGLLCDAIVVFRPDLAGPLRYRLRRAGYGWSKMRFSSAQLLAYVEDGLWLRLAALANRAALRLSQGLVQAGASLVAPVEANEVFIRADGLVERLAGHGVLATDKGGGVARFVCRFDTTVEDIERAIRAFGGRPPVITHDA